MEPSLSFAVALFVGSLAVASPCGAAEPPAAPEAMAAEVRTLVSSGAGALMPDLDRAYIADGGLVPLGEGDFPAMFLHGLVAEWRDGVAVFPVEVRLDDATGDAYFLDALGEPFWYIPSDVPERYRPWLVANPWFAPSRAGIRWTFVHDADVALLRAASAPAGRRAAPLRSVPPPPVTNLCFTGFSYTGTSVWFSSAWPSSALPLPGGALDVYAKTNLLDALWFPLAELPVAPAATNATLEIPGEDIPGFFVPPHVHDDTCPAVTNVTFDLAQNALVTGIVYRCYRYQAVSSGFLRLGTRLDTDGDGLSDAYETLAFGTDPDNPDTDGDGVPDGAVPADWHAHPLRAANAGATNLVIALSAPLPEGATPVLSLGTLRIPLDTSEGPWTFFLPEGELFECSLHNPGTNLVALVCGPPDGSSCPLWCEDYAAVFGGNAGGGHCRFAVPSLTIEPAAAVGRWESVSGQLVRSVCLHDAGPVLHRWTLLPDAALSWLVPTPVWPAILSTSGDLGLVPSATAPETVGTLSFRNFDETGAHSRLWGTLSPPLAAHRCEGFDETDCLSCGRRHGDLLPCFHAPDCATKTNLLADCDCAAPFVRIGATDAFALAGSESCCCSAAGGLPPELLSASPGLGATIEGDSLRLAPEAASPTIGGFLARYRLHDATGGIHRTLSLRATAADLGIDPLLSSAWPPPGGGDAADYLVRDGTLHLARRSAPYPLRLWNESPSDARLVLSFDTPTNGPLLREASGGPGRGSFAATNATPWSALDGDATVYLDASYSNATASLSLALSDPAADRTFLSESLSVRVVDTALGEHWRARSSTDRLAWDFSDAPEPVWIGVGHAGADGVLTNTISCSESRTPSLPLDLPPGDYALEAYFPRVYDGVSSVAWATNRLHILDNPAIVSLDGCDSLNETDHHTSLYETNALVVRRAQSFRFKTTVTKGFDPARHELRFFLSDDFDGHWITNEVDESTESEPTTHWFYRSGASAANADESIELTADVYCSTTNCPIGAYRFGAALFDRATGVRLDTKEMSSDLIVLFNPWSQKDSVYLAVPAERIETVMNTAGIIWKGFATNLTTKSWNYAQFSNNSMQVALLCLDALSRQTRDSPVWVSRTISWMCNANSGGIITGRWGGPYTGGKPPSHWGGSEEIFSEYLTSGQSVKYGQCWVFAGVATSLARACGIPARPVTNYDSGHDKNGDKTIDFIYDYTGFRDRRKSDSSWNFHVWTECWMERNDVDGANGWQIVDGTPQERSDGKYQCGPAPRSRVKNDQGGAFDVDFVFSEVAADIKIWQIDATGTTHLLETHTNRLGHKISTKQNGASVRLDLTGEYK